jgi:hypothetical protein
MAYAFVPEEFRTAFPEFADPAVWPESVLRRMNGTALVHIPAKPGKRLHGAARELAIAYMTAHLLKLEHAAVTGSTAGLVAGATVDKVSISLTPPPAATQQAWWYALTPYGSALRALLKSKAAGGLYVGGLPPERDAFRKAGGVFGSGKGTS